MAFTSQPLDASRLLTKDFRKCHFFFASIGTFEYSHHRAKALIDDAASGTHTHGPAILVAFKNIASYYYQHFSYYDIILHGNIRMNFGRRGYRC